jgi:Flp pilus assembly protein TadD
MGVFAKARAHDDIADVAEQLLELDPGDEGALRMLLDANRSLKRFAAALKNAEQLVRLAPDDTSAHDLLAELRRLVQRGR